MTYKQAFDKITEAYIKGEIVPMSSKFCFCGTLSPDSYWKHESNHQKKKYPYSLYEYTELESALFYGIYTGGGSASEFNEEALFQGMCAALEVLKQIHISRGETIDEIPFIKRELVDA